MHHIGFVDTEDMNVTSGKRKFSSVVGYSSSKLAQVHFLVEGFDNGLKVSSLITIFIQ
jgi:hypothetical protein